MTQYFLRFVRAHLQAWVGLLDLDAHFKVRNQSDEWLLRGLSDTSGKCVIQNNLYLLAD